MVSRPPKITPKLNHYRLKLVCGAGAVCTVRRAAAAVAAVSVTAVVLAFSLLFHASAVLPSPIRPVRGKRVGIPNDPTTAK